MLQTRMVLSVGFALLAATSGGRAATAQGIAGIDLEQTIANTRVGAAPDTFGSSSTILLLHWSAFEAATGGIAANLGNQIYRRSCEPGACYVEAPVILPNGALVESVELEGCDQSATFSMVGTLFHYAVNANSSGFPAGGSVATGATPGCTTFSSTLTPPLQVNNATHSYGFGINFGGDPGVAFRAVRIRYHLQVSPAPGVATFPIDVPTNHPFFRFIEALAEAGITAGCAPDSFCPETPVTRGQMAVFLSVALGLHFPN